MGAKLSNSTGLIQEDILFVQNPTQSPLLPDDEESFLRYYGFAYHLLIWEPKSKNLTHSSWVWNFRKISIIQLDMLIESEPDIFKVLLKNHKWGRGVYSFWGAGGHSIVSLGHQNAGGVLNTIPSKPYPLIPSIEAHV
ncbi:unnamed protein product [Lepeophtheirus salmonis]|uniref:(salmon louse) hypothetical protein n=1 Tax=Lepeophtheirus salmonis TaxID=72036 RepID=A0A817FEC7_LEPSM|nr:unnamed protein product [Lepeophtheirus salmonis]